MLGVDEPILSITNTDPFGAGVAYSYCIIASLCMSFPPLMWSLHALRVCYKNGGRKPVFISFLLINIIFYFALSPPTILLLLNHDCSVACLWGVKLFQMTQLSGIYLHQLVALESVLSLRHPLYTTNLFSLPCSFPLFFTLYLLAFICVFTQDLPLLDFIVQCPFCLMSVLILTLTVVFTYKAPSSPPPDPVTHSKLTRWVMVVAMVTMIIYMPYFLTAFILRYTLNLGERPPNTLGALYVTLSFMSLRVIFDTFLCVLVFKKVLPVQSAQTQAEPNALCDLSANSGGVAIQHP